jgi:hypothetical protein
LRPKIWKINDDETPVNFIKQSINKGEKARTNKNTQVLVISAKTQRGLERGKGTNYVPKPPQVARTILEKEKEGKPESILSLEEPSLSMMTCFKIKTPRVFCKAMDTPLPIEST